MRQAVHLYRLLVEESPQDAMLRNEYAGALAYLGVALESRGRLAAAEEPYRQAILVYQALSADAPDREWYRHEQAYFSLALAAILQKAGQYEAALEHCQASVRLNVQLATDFPELSTHPERLTQGREMLISLLSNLGRTFQRPRRVGP